MKDLRSVVHQYRSASRLRDGARLSDGQLLEAFIQQRDQAAFESLLQMHGSMVFGVCRRILGNHHDAEDAFQATFLVLAKSAGTILYRTSLACWLYGVAQRSALKARQARLRRQTREAEVARSCEVDETQQDQSSELAAVLDQEVSLLPHAYREAFILCDLEGKTYLEAATRSGATERAISMRLLRARELLAKRLTRRGLVLSAAALTTLLTSNTSSASVPATLTASTTHVAAAVAFGQTIAVEGISSNVVTLTQGVLKSMTLTKIQYAIVAILLMSAVGLGMGHWLMQVEAAPPQAASQTSPAQKKTPPAPEKNEALVAKKKEILDLARKNYETMLALYRNARVSSTDEVCQWSYRWLEAERSVNERAEDQIAPVEAHIQRLKELEEICIARKQQARGTDVDLNTAKYYRLEAERILIELK